MSCPQVTSRRLGSYSRRGLQEEPGGSIIGDMVLHDWMPLMAATGDDAPPSWTPEPGEPDEHEDVATEELVEARTPKRYKVLLHNDDFTTMEFVVDLLVRFFRKSHTEATHIMLMVHTKGSGVAGVYPREVAETKVAQATEYARENGHPLLCTMEAE